MLCIPKMQIEKYIHFTFHVSRVEARGIEISTEKMLLKTLIIIGLADIAFGFDSISHLNDKIVANGGKWKATETRHSQDDKYRNALLEKHPMGNLNVTTDPLKLTDDVPSGYDVREEFPKCESVSTIFDQGSCGGCWALSVAPCNLRGFFW